MRKIISYMHLSLDGFVQGDKDWDINWVIHDEEIDKYNKTLQDSVDTVLYGRVTYQGMENFWSSVPNNPSSSKNEVEYANWINQTHKIVFSKTLDQVNWKNTRLMKENIVEEIYELKTQPGKDILILGSPSITSLFTRFSLIDEYWMNINPIILGSGKPFFKDIIDRVDLELMKNYTFDSGVVSLVYSVREGKNR